MTETDSIIRRLRELERRLLDPEIRRSPRVLRSLLAGDFLEFASSGEACDRAQVIESLRRAPPTRFALTDFRVVVLSPEVALATYRISRKATPDRPAGKSLRSSIWKRINGRWQMVFHQGTPVE